MYEQFMDWKEFDIIASTEDDGKVTLMFRTTEDTVYKFNLDKGNCKTLAKILRKARELAYKN